MTELQELTKKVNDLEKNLEEMKAAFSMVTGALMSQLEEGYEEDEFSDYGPCGPVGIAPPNN